MKSCHDCAYLRKSIKIPITDVHYTYGCSSPNRTRAVGFCSSDRELKWMGCSDWQPIQLPEQINMFDLLQ